MKKNVDIVQRNKKLCLTVHSCLCELTKQSPHKVKLLTSSAAFDLITWFSSAN